MRNGIITKLFDWIAHPTFATDIDPLDWFAGLVVVLIICWLWSRVICQLVEG